MHLNKKLQWVTGTSRFLEHKSSLNAAEFSKKSKIMHLFFLDLSWPVLYPLLSVLWELVKIQPEGVGHPAPRAALAGGGRYPTHAHERGLAGMKPRGFRAS